MMCINEIICACVFSIPIIWIIYGCIVDAIKKASERKAREIINKEKYEFNRRKRTLLKEIRDMKEFVLIFVRHTNNPLWPRYEQMIANKRNELAVHLGSESIADSEIYRELYFLEDKFDGSVRTNWYPLVSKHDEKRKDTDSDFDLVDAFALGALAIAHRNNND